MGLAAATFAFTAQGVAMSEPEVRGVETAAPTFEFSAPVVTGMEVVSGELAPLTFPLLPASSGVIRIGYCRAMLGSIPVARVSSHSLNLSPRSYCELILSTRSRSERHEQSSSCLKHG